MLISGRKALLFPVETTVRELDYRIILGCMCCRGDNQVFIGNHTDIYELGKRLRHALYVGKNLLNVSPARQTVCYEDFKQAEGRMIHLDEEGALFPGGEEAWKATLDLRLKPSWLRSEDYLCTWGEFQRRHYLAKESSIQDHILATGHPRLNLAHAYYAPFYETETEAIRRKFGRFVLVNTNFSFGNHGVHSAAMLKDKRVDPEDRVRRNHYLDAYAHCAGKLPVFLQLASRISDAFPDMKVVFRPHPSENPAVYEAMAEYIPRMTVAQGGSLVAWLHAAEFLVHAGCTTAIEGMVAGTRIINFQPLEGEDHVQQVPNLVGVKTRTLAEVVEVIRDWRGSTGAEVISAEAKARIKDLLVNIDESDGAFRNFRDLVWRIQDEQPPTRVAGNLAPFVRRGQTERIKKTLRSMLPWQFQRVDRLKAYRRRRFAALAPDLVGPKLEAANRILGTRIQVQYLSSKLMVFTQEGA